MIQSTSSRKSEAQKWAKALERAIAEALDVLVEPISGEAFVESATRPGILYHVSAQTCSCPAGQKGQICKHRACYLAQIGELPLEPETLIVMHVPALVDCAACNGCGSVYANSGGWKCEVCQGRGQVAVAPAPAVSQPAAVVAA
jgi:hypothetical protein